MTKLTKSDQTILECLQPTKTIALIGASNKKTRPSYEVQNYLKQAGYQIFPVNPVLRGRQILGRRVAGQVQNLKTPIDMVDIFRRSEHVRDVYEDILKMTVLPKIIWMQIGVSDEEVAKDAKKLGIKVFMNRCPKIEHLRLLAGR